MLRKAKSMMRNTPKKRRNASDRYLSVKKFEKSDKTISKVSDVYDRKTKTLKMHKLKYDLNELFENPIFEVPSINYNDEKNTNVWNFIANDILSPKGKLTETINQRNLAYKEIQNKMYFMDMKTQLNKSAQKARRAKGRRVGGRMSTSRFDFKALKIENKVKLKHKSGKVGLRRNKIKLQCKFYCVLALEYFLCIIKVHDTLFDIFAILIYCI